MWLSKQLEVTKGYEFAHSVDTGRNIDVNKAFQVIHFVPLNLPHGLQVRPLYIPEAITIHIQKTNLCTQKKFV